MAYLLIYQPSKGRVDSFVYLQCLDVYDRKHAMWWYNISETLILALALDLTLHLDLEPPKPPSTSARVTSKELIADPFPSTGLDPARTFVV